MNKSLVQIVSLTALLGSSWLTAATAATITFADGDFSTTPALTIFGVAAGQSAARQASGGNPGAYLSVSTVTNSTTFTGFFTPGAVYNPSQGAITSIQWSIDYRNIASIGQGQAVALTLEQGGSYFRAGPFVTGSANFNWQSQPLTTFVLADFVRLSGSGTLNFGVNGAPISIGFSTGNSGGYGIVVGYDNFTTVLNTATVPVPPAAWLFVSATGLLVGGLRRRASTAPIALATS